MTDVVQRRTVVPRRLVQGDAVGIVAPSSAFEEEKFRQGIETIREMGFLPVIPEELFLKKRYLAGTDDHRARLINRMFADDDIKAIFCARGGYGASRLLPYLDWETICTHPKIFVGFSDVSVLLSAFYTRCGLATFHGPVVTSLADADQETKIMLKAVISSGAPVIHEPPRPIVIRSGIAKGGVVGGNLCTLCHLAGTAFSPDTAGRILFLEECGEPPYKIDRMLNHLKMCGWFDALEGFMLGTFDRCDNEEIIRQIVEETVANAAFPVMGGFEIGHGRRNRILPIGIEAILDTRHGRLSFCGSATLPADEEVGK
ncbi:MULTISPECIES: S66 peptidase family protein [Desulfococcus]|jgi:muramoyltetrapeptide carboxypeptidase|uniref:Peptidase U61 LD-carboxypeptidase A n=1 Tax=Desulfococcus multivorans DSM 2059 TaxID=1121405 RepID=S7UXU0_DESML|nr:LD-carboxypeptidase [Desulfococcus multivorans]AOY57975.1 peptidase, S66 family, LD-carboxypeptidase A [Desulfococcus multivorans]AQV00343.1 hypothetical protein B2D07_05855 [Desulfococcus multivorans]EPR39059.1 peptidase U61 LD-carboxypeptidase A [Desulfococcus multivorans DSM 2059]MDX9817279.1 LD-carboxypeptidase [Desulfococcus multivorans]SJZ63972.1 muramoyltetrapeptide carboxypeptidase [Desulfococcus multivorans DSM 2059]